MTNQYSAAQKIPFRERVYRLVEPVPDATRLEKFIDQFLLLMIVISILVFILATVPSLEERFRVFFQNFELFAVAVFTIEYIAHLYTCTINPKYRGEIWGRLRYALTFMMIIDLLAILPSYLLFLSGELVILRTLRLFRVARILKFNRYSSALRAVQTAWIKKAPQLAVAVGMLAGLIIVASSLLYAVETEHHDGLYFTSIPDAMWATVATVTPLGYDNYYPNTLLGRILMMMLSIFGIAFVALPAGIFASAFSDQLSDNDKSPTLSESPPTETEIVATPNTITCKCPHCEQSLSIQIKL